MRLYTETLPSRSAGSNFQSTIFGSNSSFLRKLPSRFTETLAWIMLDMSMGSIARGNRKMLKRESATKALSAVSRSSGLFRLAKEYVVNVASVTCKFSSGIYQSSHKK